MSSSTPGHAATPSTSSPRVPARGRENPAHDDDAATAYQTTVYLTESAVIVARPDFTRIENWRQGFTHYGEAIPRTTRAALAEVAHVRG